MCLLVLCNLESDFCNDSVIPEWYKGISQRKKKRSLLSAQFLLLKIMWWFSSWMTFGNIGSSLHNRRWMIQDDDVICSLVPAWWSSMSLLANAKQQDELFWGGFSSTGDFFLFWRRSNWAYRWFYLVCYMRCVYWRHWGLDVKAF